MIILGSGPNRIGQGIEFDYCCVHASMSLRDAGYETVMVNCNPETVSTDYDTSDRLYFEPLTDEDVANVLDAEQAAGGKVVGVIVSLGGQTPLKLAGSLPPELVLGTSPASIDLAEDRERWNALCHELSIPQPPGGTATTSAEALAIAGRIGYPVLLRPSYVLGGRAMEIVYDDDGVRRVMQAMTTGALAREGGVTAERPVLVDRFLEDAVEVDVDAVRDGAGEILIAGVMEHVEEAGVHSGDSACALPPQTLREDVVDMLERHTRSLAESLDVCGLINVQFAVKDGQVYVLEANPRASRTVPFVAKATGVPLAMVAARVMVGQTLAELRQEGLLPADVIGRVPVLDHVSVKEAVLPFDRFPGVDTLLGPEMRSTGEVMGVDITFGLAFAKSQMAAGTRLPDSGTVFLSLADRDKPAGLEVARAFSALGFSIAATLGTAGYLRSAGRRGRHARGQGGGGGRGLRRRRAHRTGQGAARREHAARPRAAGGRPAHPHGVGGLQGAVPDHAGRGTGGGGGHGRHARPPAAGAPAPGPASGPGSEARGERPRTTGRVGEARHAGGRRRARQPDHDGLGDVRPRHRAGGVRRRSADLGAVVVKSLSVEPWPGNPAPRVHEVGAGMLNSVGLQGPGLAAWLDHDLPALSASGARVVVSIWGRTVADYARAAELVAGAAAVGRGRLHRGARGQRELPQRRGSLTHVRPLGGGDVQGHGGHGVRPAPLGQAQPQRARPGRDRVRRARGRCRRVDAGEHAARPRPRRRDRAGPFSAPAVAGSPGARCTRSPCAPCGSAGAPSPTCPSSAWAG